MLVISDLHLEHEDDALTRTLSQFLRNTATQHEQLFILGDLFELWIGDDENSALAARVADELNQLGDSGTKVYLMHGNRDFLIGEQFASQAGLTLVQEPYIIGSPENPVVLLHGDILCTLDTEYMRFRTMVRNPHWQQEFLSKPIAERQQFAHQARARSKQDTGQKAEEIMDVTASEVNRLMQELNVRTMIHGHTHRPNIHHFKLQNAIHGSTDATRVVLGDWHRKGWYAIYDGNEISLQHFPLLP